MYWLIKEACNFYVIFIRVFKYEGSAYFWPGGFWVSVLDLVQVGVMSAKNSSGAWVKSEMISCDLVGWF